MSDLDSMHVVRGSSDLSSDETEQMSQSLTETPRLTQVIPASLLSLQAGKEDNRNIKERNIV